MKKIIAFLALILSGSIAPRFHAVKNARQLEKLVDDYEFSVVCFAPSGQFEGEDLDRGDKMDRKKEFRAVQDVVKSASERTEYKKFLSKDVGFMMVDVASKQAGGLVDEYDLGAAPTCFVFEQGAPDTHKKVMRPASVKDLTRLLEQEGGDSLKKLLKDRKEEADLIRQERISQNYLYASAYPYWGGYGWGGYGWGGYGWGGYGYGWRGRPYGGWGWYAGY